MIVNWSPVKGYSGATSNMLAVVSVLSIEESYNSLLIDMNRVKSTANSLMDRGVKGVDYDNGFLAIKRLVKSNLLTAANLENCTETVYKGRLDYLPCARTGMSEEETEQMDEIVLGTSLGIYDLVWVDVDSGDSDAATRRILEGADIVLVNLPQDKHVIEHFYASDQYTRELEGKSYIIVIGKYNSTIKYSLRSVRREQTIKSPVYGVPYYVPYQNAANKKEIYEFFQRELIEQRTRESRKFTREVKKITKGVIKLLGETKEPGGSLWK